MPIKPEETADVAERRNEAETEVGKEIEELRQYYKSIEQFLSETKINHETAKTVEKEIDEFINKAADSPEALKVLAKDMGEDYSLVVDNADHMRTAVKMTMDLDVSEEEVSELREQPQSIEDDIREELKRSCPKKHQKSAQIL